MVEQRRLGSARTAAWTARVMTRGVIGMLLLVAWAASAAPAREAAQAPTAVQWVFVIDDSGSMGDPRFGETDPDRLAVFAVRALLGALDDRDWATVVRLGGPGQGEAPPPLAPLAADHRQRLGAVLDTDAELARYAGANTPCRRALEAVRDLLDGSAGAGLPRAVLFLSDGECTPAGQERVLDLFPSSTSLAQFHLLRFRGTSPSRELETLAARTGGSVLEVGRGDPSGILYTFARAISSTQGYEAQVLGPGSVRLPAHRGARRVRLVAVAPGGGRPLELGVTDSEGRAVPVNLGERGVHRYQQGRAFRFAIADYRPTGGSVLVSLVGAGEGWQVVALPEYRLAVDLELVDRPCGAGGRTLEADRVAAGSDLCARVRLLDELGRPVGQDVTAGRLEGVVELRTASGAASDPVEVVANPASATESTFELDLQGLAEGYHGLRAAVRILPRGGGPPRQLWARERTVQAVDRSVEPVPARVDFGTLYPGSTAVRQVKLEGRFPEARAVARIRTRPEVEEGVSGEPSCVRLHFAGRPPGEPVAVVPGQGYALRLEADAECPVEAVRAMAPLLELRLPDLLGEMALEIPLAWTLDASVRSTEPVVLEMAAGEVRTLELPVPVGAGEISPGAGRIFAVHLGPSTDGEERPTDDLELHLLDPRAQPRLQGGRWSDVGIEVRAGACCVSGDYRAEVRLRPVARVPGTDPGVPGTGGPMLAVPVEVRVQGDAWTCHRDRLLLALLVLLAILALAYLRAMWAHSHFLRPARLASRLRPLRWPDSGGAPRPAPADGTDADAVHDLVRDGLRWHRRLLAWLRANPLVIGLPGRRYRETLELGLGTRYDACWAQLVPERDVVTRLQRATGVDDLDDGRLFVVATGGEPGFAAVHGKRGLVGRLDPGWRDSADPPRLEIFQRGQRLVHRVAERDRNPRELAGWQLG